MSFWRALVVALLSATSAVHAVYVETGDCATIERNHYKYVSTEYFFEDEMEQSSIITALFHVTCESTGTYKNSHAVRFVVEITDVDFSGSVVDSNRGIGTHQQGFEERISKNNFKYAQHRDGSIPAAFLDRNEDIEVANLKKSIVAAFQANFEGTKHRTESDTGSLHTANYHYTSTIQDAEAGIMSMTRTIDSEDILSYAEHIPVDEIAFHKEEEITYNNGVLTKANGQVTCNIMPNGHGEPVDEIEEDNLESVHHRTRRSQPADPDKIKSYDSSIVTHKYDTRGSYSLNRVGTSRVVRQKRSTKTEDLVETTLLGFINQTRRSIEKIGELRQKLGDIEDALDQFISRPNNTRLAQTIEALLKLESKYGPQETYPAIDVVLERFESVLGSKDTKDMKERIDLYFLLSGEGSLRSQLALLNGLDQAKEEEELESVRLYIALVENPQPLFIARLESRISTDVNANDPLLLVYGAIIPRASPELQERMAVYLTDRLSKAEKSLSSLIHHLLSLGNAGSNKTIDNITKYINNPDKDVQLIAIFSLRFVLNEPKVLESLRDVVTKSNSTEEHAIVVAKSLVLGTERAKLKHETKPYSQDLAESLVLLAVASPNEELRTATISYLKLINSTESRSLLKLLKQAIKLTSPDEYSNATRFRRGKQWDESNPVYDLVAPLSERQSDVRTYQHRLSYIWGKQFGAKDINAQVAAGGIAGVANSGSYKLFGHAVAKANCYDRSLTIIEFLILRQKDSSATLSRVYAVVLGITVVNIRLEEDPDVCFERTKDLYEGKEYTIFDFTYSVFVVVGTLNFDLKATIQFSAAMYVKVCESHGKVTVETGLSPTLTIVVSASGNLEIVWVAKAGLTLEATFNYQVLPEVNSEFCYTQGQIRVKNCLGIYHQWTDNTLELYAWYAWRGWCGWWACTGSNAYKDKKKIPSLSISWDLPGTDKLTIWEVCDNDYTC